MSGFDPLDSTSVERSVDDLLSGLNRSIKGLKIGLPKEYFAEGLAPSSRVKIEAAIKTLEGLGAIISEISLPNSPLRSEERRVGKECVSKCRSRWSPGH